jgi:hypothetical protein
MDPPTASFGFQNIQTDPNAGRNMISSVSTARQNPAVIVNLSGEFDPEFLHIKSQQGANMISNRSVTTQSQR